MKKRTTLILGTVVATMVLALVPAAGADEQYEFETAVFDIAAAPDGSILVGENGGEGSIVKEIRKGEIGLVSEIDAPTRINGLAAIGRGNFFLTTEGSDLAQDGELWRVSRGAVRQVADLAAFELNNDPDAFAGPQWKDQACEAIDGFSAGPQNNPFHVTAASGGTALVADAAGNTVLSATTSGAIDWVALFTPPIDENGDWLIRWFAGENEDIPCYVQPVPTSVAVGPNGDLYVGELTGARSVADGLFPIGLSRVWRISAGANNVVCSQTDPTPDCELLIDGLTSVIDLAFGPDGNLYVVEYDESSWFSLFIPPASGGTISAYDTNGNLVAVVATELQYPSAITFDKWGDLWLLENNDTGATPTVRQLDLP